MMQTNLICPYKRCRSCYLEYEGYPLFCKDCLTWTKLEAHIPTMERIETRNNRQISLLDFVPGELREVA